MYFESQYEEIMQEVLHNSQNEENADDDYELVNMDDGGHKDINYVDQFDSKPDDDSVETDNSEQCQS